MEIKFWYILSAGVIALDLILKVVMEGVNITVIPNVLSFISVHNYGASFGVLDGARWFFIVLAILFVIGMVLFDFLYKKNFRANGWYRVGFALILGGIIGNLVDRIAFGYVRDFISLDFIDFPVFNIADMALTFGCICLVVFILFFAFRSEKPQEKTVTFTSNNSTKKELASQDLDTTQEIQYTEDFATQDAKELALQDVENKTQKEKEFSQQETKAEKDSAPQNEKESLQQNLNKNSPQDTQTEIIEEKTETEREQTETAQEQTKTANEQSKVENNLAEIKNEPTETTTNNAKNLENITQENITKQETKAEKEAISTGKDNSLK